MLQRGFIKLLKRYREGTLPGPVKEAMDIWFHTIQKTPVEENEKAEIRERIWSGIESGRLQNASPNQTIERKSWWRKSGWQVAAILLITLGLGYYLMKEKPVEEITVSRTIQENQVWNVERNNQVVSREIRLPDGTRVVLEQGARLRFPSVFENESRTVFLEGNGFFDVVKDSDRPFLVYSGAVVTRVLGTSFTIRTNVETGGTEVAVMTGKVVVEKNRIGSRDTDILNKGENENRVVLTPNKKVTFFENSDHYVTGLVDKPVLVVNREEFLKPGAFDFDETPLSEVLEKLEKAYGVEITLSNDQMLDCPVTADLSSDNLFEKIEIIGAVLNAEYEITGSAILLLGGGCPPAKILQSKH